MSVETRKEQAKDNSQATIDSLQRVIQQGDAESEDMARVIQQIQDGFRQINEAEGRITKEQEGAPADGAIVENMRFIQQQMRLNRKLIAELRQQLRNASQTNKESKNAYEAMIDEFDSQLQAKNEELKTLRRQLVERDSTIGKQIEQIDILNDNVENLTAKNEEKDRKMNEQDQVINTAWYVFGTKRTPRTEHPPKRRRDAFG